MAASTKWAAFSGLAIVVAALVGTAAWRHLHPEAASPLAALDPVVKQLTPAPGPAPATNAPKATPPRAVAPIEAATTPDRGPEPPSAPNPQRDTAPSFDVVRVEPSGEAVVAGKGKPDSEVSLLASGKVVAQTKTDANGQFVMTPPALKPGAYDLSLQQTASGKPTTESRQAVAVAVPEKGKGQVVVALAEPGKPTRLLAAPAPEPPSAPTPAEATPSSAPPKAASVAPKLSIRTVELENATGFYATGTAPPGNRLRVYLNDSHLTDLTAGTDGAWTLRIRKGLTGGRYTVRVDALAADGSKVTARTEVPFDVPANLAQETHPAPPPDTRTSSQSASEVTTASRDAPLPPSAPNPADSNSAGASIGPAIAQATPASPSDVATTGAAKAGAAKTDASPTTPAPARQADAGGSSPASNAVIESIETAIVAPGDNLWNISRVRLGEGVRYTRIYTANANQIRDPNLIYPGQVFVLPKE